MAFPKLGTERARPDISETFFAYDLAANMARMIGPLVFPVREVQEAHGVYPYVSAKELMKKVADAASKPTGYALERAPRSAYVRDEFAFENRPYRTIEFGKEGPVDDNESAHYRSYFEHEMVTAVWLRHDLLVEAELRVSTQVMDTTTFAAGNNNGAPAGERDPDGTTVNPGAGPKWTDWANARPIEDVFNAKRSVFALSGVMPDTVCMNNLAWENLIQCTQIRERIHSQGAGDRDRAKLITRQQVAQIFNVDDVLVGQAVHDSSNPNASAFAPAYIWGPHCAVFKRIRGRDIREVGLGHTFHWAIDRSMPNGYVEDYREPQTRGNIIRVRHQTQELMKYAAVNFLIHDVI